MGQPIEVHPLEAASRSAYFLGFYERETTAWALNYFRKEQPKVLIDIGAHFGYFIYLALAELTESSIYAFEPDPNNLAWLQRNISMIQTTNHIELEALAVSDQTSTVRFMTSDSEKHNNLWAGISTQHKSTGNEIEIPAVSLDNYCEEKKLKHVDLVIMDIEGGEGFAVDGMANGIKNHLYKNVLVEFHPEYLKGKHSPDRIIQRFIDAGYTAYHFQSPFVLDGRSDKISGFYDLSWDETYLIQVDATVPLAGWEHILFSI